MNIAIYNAFFSPETLDYVKTVVSYLEKHGHQFIIVDRLRKYFGENQDRYNYFSDNKVLKENIDFGVASILSMNESESGPVQAKKVSVSAVKRGPKAYKNR